MGGKKIKGFVPLVALVLLVSLLASGLSCAGSSAQSLRYGDWNPEQLGYGTISRLPLSGGGSYYLESIIIRSQTELDDYISDLLQQDNWIGKKAFLKDLAAWQIDFTTHSFILYRRFEASGENVVTLGELVVEGSEVSIDVNIVYGMSAYIGSHCHAYKVSKAITGVTFVMEYEDDVLFNLSDGEIVHMGMPRYGLAPSITDPAEISRLEMPEHGGNGNYESVIIKSQSDLDDFVSEVQQRDDWHDLPSFLQRVDDWAIDFTTHNLIICRNFLGSSFPKLSVDEPRIEGSAVTIDMHTEDPFGPVSCDIVTYSYAYKVSKAVTSVTFVGGGPIVFFRMSDGQVITQERTQAYGTSSISDGILFQLSTDKTHYAPGEQVIVNAYVENLTTQDYHYTTPSLGPDLYIRIVSQDKSGSAINAGSGLQQLMIRPTTIGGGVIKAGSRVSLDVSWDQTLFYDSMPSYSSSWDRFDKQLRSVEPSQYTIKAIFEAHSFDPISMNIWIDDEVAD